MRHLTTLTVSLMVLVAAVGCNDIDTSDLSTTTSTSAAAPETPTSAAAPETPTSAAAPTTPTTAAAPTTEPSHEEPTGAADSESEPADPGSTGDETAFPAAPYGWTPECVAALVTYFKIAEPTVSAIDWSTATSFEVSALNEQFAAEGDAFEALTVDRGCGTELLSTADGLAFVRELAVVHTPGMVDYIDFIAERETGG